MAAIPSVAFPFKGSDNATYTGQTIPTDSNGNVPVVTAPTGLGSLTSVPAATTNGTAIGTLPTGAKGVRIYLPSGATLTFTVASTAPTSAPANTFTISQASTGPNWDEPLAGGQMIYITAVTGSPLFRFQ